MRPPQLSFAEASAIEKVNFAGDAWNSRDEVAGERGAAAAERDIHGFAPKLDTDEGNWDIAGNKPRRTVHGNHAEMNAEECQMAISSIVPGAIEERTHSTMMAWRVHEFGPPKVMRFE